jgi:L-ascorbate metabolism protein UlaG (beta-lactamase superfamily)
MTLDNKVQKFYNTDPNIKPKGFFEALKWKLTSRASPWPKNIPLACEDTPPPVVGGDETRISFVGHVTFLIQTNGLNIITDPVFSDRASPLSFAGPKRVTPPGIAYDNLPKIDVILISHNHYDHMDVPTIKKIWLRDKPLIIAPLKNDITLKANIPHIEIMTLAWGEKTSISQGFEFALEPAQHWSARGLFDRNKALWGTFIIKTPKGHICFIGDTGYNKKIFQDIGNKYQDILVSLIPIGAYEPRWFMKDIHINPEEAALIHQDLNSKHSIASHFQTFRLADDAYDQPAKELEEALVKYNISPQIFITPKIGGVYLF